MHILPDDLVCGVALTEVVSVPEGYLMQYPKAEGCVTCCSRICTQLSTGDTRFMIDVKNINMCTSLADVSPSSWYLLSCNV